MNLTSDISNQYNSSVPNQFLLTLKDDFSLWQEFKRGSQEAFAIIYHKSFSDLFNYGLKLTTNEDLAKDCLQELFVSIWFSKEKLADVQSIKFYLLKSFRRSLIRALQKSKKENISKILFTQNQPDILFSTEELLVAEESLNIKKERLTKILNSLPKRRKEAVYLRYFRELSYEETASVMNLSEKAVINHIYKAFKAIKQSTGINSNLDMLLG